MHERVEKMCLYQITDSLAPSNVKWFTTKVKAYAILMLILLHFCLKIKSNLSNTILNESNRAEQKPLEIIVEVRGDGDWSD